MGLPQTIFWRTVITALIFLIALFLYKLIFSQPMFAGSRSSRLAKVSKEITDKFDKANATQRRRAALNTCLIAIKQQNLKNEVVDKALNLLTAEKIDQSLATELASLSNKSDECYFDLEEQKGRDAESLSAFYEARILSALAFAMTSDSAMLHESIYEAIKACNDEPEALEAAKKALNS
jgi:septal ring factor EnvC (AmiA/AmiB activator)